MKKAGEKAKFDSKLFKQKNIEIKKILKVEIKIPGSNNVTVLVGDMSL